MSKTQTISKECVKITRKLWIGIVTAGLIFIGGFSYLHNSFVSFRNNQLLDNHFRQYNYDMFVFCYNHDIKPCDNKGIWIWNADNPTDKFDYKSAQQIADEVQLNNY